MDNLLRCFFDWLFPRRRETMEQVVERAMSETTDDDIDRWLPLGLRKRRSEVLPPKAP